MIPNKNYDTQIQFGLFLFWIDYLTLFGIMIPNGFGLIIVNNSFGLIRTIGLLYGRILPNIGDDSNPILGIIITQYWGL